MKRLLTTLAVASLASALLGPSAQAHEQAPTRTLFDVGNLDTGAPPGLVWAKTTGRRSVIHGPAGRTAVDGKVAALAPMGSGYVVQTSRTGRATTRWIGADGTPAAISWRGSTGLAVSAGGEAVAFTGPKGRVIVIDSEGDRVLRMPRVPAGINTTAAGLAGEDCKEDATSDGCTVFVNSLTQPTSWLTTSHGIVDSTPFQRVSTVRGRWLGGITKVTDTGSCSAMKRNLRTKWRTCSNRFSDISPTNGQVLGIPAYGDGFGPTRLDLLDLRSGDRVRSWVPDRRGTTATYFDEVWEDSTHLLVVTFQDEEWAIVRLGLDGSMEYAVPPIPDGGDMASPFHLQTR